MLSKTFSLRLQVYNEDTDHYGIVHHSNYLRYMERARTEWVLAAGMRFDQFGVIFVVHEAELQYLKPARFNDELTIDSCIKHQRRVSQTFEHIIYLTENPEWVVCKGLITVVTLSNNLRPCAYPSALII